MGKAMTRTVDATMKTSMKFAHFVLRVSDMEKSVAWYSTVLGMKIVHQNPMLAFMTYDDEHHRLALVQIQGEVEMPAGGPGLDHVAYTLDSLEALLATYKRLKAQDVLPVWPINHGLTTSMYYADPDGNRVEFQIENMDNKEDLMAFMHSETFATNPIGVNFDPEKLLERYEQGDPLEELLQQGSA
jgi:catechol-2,3-dioxygenase